MRIGIDARCLEWQRGGVARILLKMLEWWPSLTTRHHFFLYFAERFPEDPILEHPIFERKAIKGPRFLRRRSLVVEQVLLPIQLRRDRLDLFFAPWYSSPLCSPCAKTVVGAWDISYTTHKEHYPPWARFRLSFLSRQSCRRAAGVFTCSPFDGRQIEIYYGVPSERICVLRLAADNKFQPTSDPENLVRLRGKYGLPGRYILSLGMIFTRRNVATLIDAFLDICGEYADIGLVVVGRNVTFPFVDIEALMKPLIERGRGVYLPWVAEEDLVPLYGGAWYYVCTSTVDGESIMLKEAMKCGTPVITSPLLEESVGGAAVIVSDPTSRREMADVFRRVLVSSQLRQHYAEQGLKWVQALSWKNVAEESLRFLESM